ncbi:protein-glutamate O-methyltransferase CheR [Deltaproteobacteria bacterium TL4]
MNLTLQEFISIRDFIYQRTGLFFEDKKIFFIKKRLIQRIAETDTLGSTDYLRLLKFSDPNGQELQNLINIVTTNETYFFREFEQLACFGEDCLPVVKDLKKNLFQKHIYIWCAACSTGEEAYSLAIIVKEMLLDEDSSWKCKIIATDIDQNVLKHANAGIYDDRSVKDVPEEYFEKYFVNLSSGYHVKSSIKDLVRFQHQNLMDRAIMREQKDFDFIFCRNALIYFDDASRKEVVNHFYHALNPGGFIYLGHAESIGRLTTNFKLRRFGQKLVYQKPVE